MAGADHVGQPVARQFKLGRKMMWFRGKVVSGPVKVTLAEKSGKVDVWLVRYEDDDSEELEVRGRC